jgi:pimeloyl-ACP methyl ester carboxylesterase
MRPALLTAFVVAVVAITAHGDGPADNVVDKVRPIPPKPKDPVSATDKVELQKGVDELGAEIESLRATLKGKPDLLALLPDVQILHNAVRYALTYDEVFDAKKEVPYARKQLQLGVERAKALKAGSAPWTVQTGLVVRGYLSKIDGSVQPYGLVVPKSYEPDGKNKHRLDVWCHGRGETLSEINFIQGRLTSPGEFTPPDAFVLHLYGRYCNANKFAGEIDCFEALDDVKKHYRIDDNRLVMRGFSMGGAACWQFAVHYPDVWCAAAPGAGFAETAEFLNIFQNEKVQPTDYEKKLWHWYDCTDYAVNLFNLPTVAYSGEIDRQKQAADVMERAMKAEGLELVHLIGPKTGHSYHPETKKDLNRRIDAIAEKGRDPLPKQVKFQTYTLRYNRSFWVTIDALKEHWTAARVEAEIGGPSRVAVKTKGVHAISLTFPAETMPFAAGKEVEVEIDGETVAAGAPRRVGRPAKEFGFAVHLARRKDGSWAVAADDPSGAPVKRHGLQGPIDDAFLDRFLMVRPTGHPMNEAVGKWADAEMKHAVTHWRQQFRGEAIVKDDKAITDADVAESNLVLWGDPSSNAVLAKIADKLPVKWTKEGVVVGKQTFAAATHVPVLIYPNPLNPTKYVVLNSGFTFREYDYLNNARQVPKLPDYAVIDATSPMTSRAPGKVVAAGFFDESWRLPVERK